MKKYSKNNILIIADTQMPYDREDYLEFCKSIAKKHKCGRFIHIGDIADCLNFSNYERDPDCPSIPNEIEALKQAFGEWSKICLLYTSPSPRDRQKSRMPSSA